MGDDILTGGFGKDTFVLRLGDGMDTITDFKLGTDSLGLADGLQYSELTFSDRHIFLGDELLVTLDRIQTTELTPDNFDSIG